MKKNHFDYCLLIVVVFLIIIGIIFLTSVSGVFSQEKFGNATYYLFHQIVYGLIPGLILGFLVFKINLKTIKKFSFFILLSSLFLMVLVFLPSIGMVSGGAQRWLKLGNISFQPSEILKISFIIYLAAWLSNPIRDKSFLKNKMFESKNLFFKFKKEFFDLLPFLLILIIIGFLLFFQSHTSTTGIILIIAVTMYFLSNSSLWHSLFLVFVGILGLLIFLIESPYRIKRIQVLLGIIKDYMGLGYQIKQISIAIGSGGLYGVGLGMSNQKFGFIPQTISDSIFAIIAEETGFIGGLILISLFVIFFWRGFKIFKSSQDKFFKLLAIGITFWISFQAFINIGAMIGVLPLTGVALPFISYDGSHIIAELIGVGILLNISKQK